MQCFLVEFRPLYPGRSTLLIGNWQCSCVSGCGLALLSGRFVRERTPSLPRTCGWERAGRVVGLRLVLALLAGTHCDGLGGGVGGRAHQKYPTCLLDHVCEWPPPSCARRWDGPVGRHAHMSGAAAQDGDAERDALEALGALADFATCVACATPCPPPLPCPKAAPHPSPPLLPLMQW